MHFALMKTYPERLKWAREQKGFTEATEAAEALGMKPPTYLAHENGSRGGARRAERYSQFFGVDLHWLLTGRGTPFGNRIQREYDLLDADSQKDLVEYLNFLKTRKKTA